MFAYENLFYPSILLSAFIGGIAYICNFLIRPKQSEVWLKLLNKFLFPSMPYEVPKTNALDYLLPPFPNTWYPVCMYTDLKAGKIKTFRVASRELVLYLDNLQNVQIQNRYCPHMGVDLVYGKIQKECIVCPFHHHCIHPTKPNQAIGQSQKETYPSEVVCGIVFVWLGSNVNERPNLQKLLKELYTCECEPNLLYFSFFERKVGGHLVDYAEHLLDVNHAPYTHGVELETLEDTLKLKAHSFLVQFAIKNTTFRPKFTYITPTFGYVDYGFGMKTFMLFVVEDVGQIRMIQMPIWSSTWKKTYRSFLAAFYTHFDFTEEAAFFSTKCHSNRCLAKNESLMTTFRTWFTETYYEAKEVEMFQKKKDLMNNVYSW
jgi:phenylpropionate dioxygenase-like ring-hydroxylating dioxygenase large terminal subunit